MIEILSSVDPTSPHVESITHGVTVRHGTITRPAETNCYIVLSRRSGRTDVLFVGPWDSATPLSYESDAEIIWIRLKLGVQYAKIPTVKLANSETRFPRMSASSVEIGDATLPVPGFRDIDAFLARMTRTGVFRFETAIEMVLDGDFPNMAPRTLRQVFLNAAGQSQERIFQIRRALQAAELLQAGRSIADVVDQFGYYDQSHLTRNLLRYIGRTPGSYRR